MKSYAKSLTIAGSDSGGGAGIQADLKAFAACGCYGMSAVTAITAQNTCGVFAIHPIPPAVIESQIVVVLEDIGADSIKIGMLHSSEVITMVASTLSRFSCANIIVDPVMVATSGDRLIEESAIATLKEQLFPLASLITPNIPEAEILADMKITTVAEMETAAQKLSRDFSVGVLLKGGHLDDKQLVDVFIEDHGNKARLLANKRISTKNSHGTGCTLSSAIAAFKARGKSLAEAVKLAERYLHEGIDAGAGYTTGKGNGPIHHFHQFWQ